MSWDWFSFLMGVNAGVIGLVFVLAGCAVYGFVKGYTEEPKHEEQ